jgi:cation:H+ antiporter
MVSFDLPVMLAAALLCYPIVLSRGVIDRWEGGVLLGSYLSYVAFAWFW